LLTANTGANYTYQWIFNGILITDADSISYYASQPGHYSVIVDDGNCNAISQPFVLNQYPTNPANIFSTGSLTPCTTDSMELELNSFYSHYQWSTGDTTPIVWINQTGSYWVDVVDQFGCAQTSSQFEISSSFLQAPAICIIGVDSASGKNRVIWERQASNLIDSIVVFRESTLAGVYQRIGSMAYNQSGVFIDQQADPAVRAWRYKLAAVDSCGALSLRSALHKSIHLTINAGLNGSWNLIWDNYVGFPISSYYIYRGTSTTNMQLLAQIPGNLSSFTDLNPPSGNVFYQLEIVKTNGCYPDSIYTKANTNYNTSRSNTASNGGLQPVFLTADFQADITTGTWPVRVQFNDQSSGNPKSWQWTFGDGNGSIEKNPAHTYNNSGTYTVSLKIKNGNYRDSIAKIGYVNVLVNGMVEFKTATELAVYPSPNHGQFVLDIKANGQRNYDARVYNMLGEQVYAQKVEVLNQALIDFDLHHLSKGVYFIVLDNKAESIQRKIIIN
jgi:PKD repeat protein